MTNPITKIIWKKRKIQYLISTMTDITLIHDQCGVEKLLYRKKNKIAILQNW